MKIYRYLDDHQIDYHAVKWADGYRLERVINLNKGDFIQGEFEDNSQPYAHLKLPDGWTLYELDKRDFELIIDTIDGLDKFANPLGNS